MAAPQIANAASSGRMVRAPGACWPVARVCPATSLTHATISPSRAHSGAKSGDRAWRGRVKRAAHQATTGSGVADVAGQDGRGGAEEGEEVLVPDHDRERLEGV